MRIIGERSPILTRVGVAFVSLSGNVDFNTPSDPRWLTRIILGWKMPESDRAQIRQWAKHREP